MDMSGAMANMSGAMAIVGIAMMAVMLLAVLWGLVGLARHRGRHASDDEAGDPRRVLDERYARGEITTEEYEERRRTLADRAGSMRGP